MSEGMGTQITTEALARLSEHQEAKRGRTPVPRADTSGLKEGATAEQMLRRLLDKADGHSAAIGGVADRLQSLEELSFLDSLKSVASESAEEQVKVAQQLRQVAQGDQFAIVQWSKEVRASKYFQLVEETAFWTSAATACVALGWKLGKVGYGLLVGDAEAAIEGAMDGME